MERQAVERRKHTSERGCGNEAIGGNFQWSGLRRWIVLVVMIGVRERDSVSQSLWREWRTGSGA